MKNILNTKTDGTPALLSNVDEAGNSLFINGTEISSSSWIGEGTYTFTVGSHTYTISKAPDNDGNYQLLKVSDYTYHFVKIVSKTIREEIEDIENQILALDTQISETNQRLNDWTSITSGIVSLNTWVDVSASKKGFITLQITDSSNSSTSRCRVLIAKRDGLNSYLTGHGSTTYAVRVNYKAEDDTLNVYSISNNGVCRGIYV